MTLHLLIFGLGYSGSAIAGAAQAAGYRVSGTGGRARTVAGVELVDFTAALPALATATHLLSTVPPDAAGVDPVLARYAEAIRAAQGLRWLGYLSSTGVYGDRGGGWVDEDTPPRPGSERARRRLAAETAWCTAAAGRRLDIFRLAGIYGPGRSAFDDLRAGRARRIDRPGHAFGRIHRDDIVAAALVAMAQANISAGATLGPDISARATLDADTSAGPAPGEAARILNLADDCPAESAAVVAEAARLLGVPPPPLLPFTAAAPSMSPMARSFWAENRKVASAQTQAALGLTWQYPSYLEGLRAILAEERGERRP